MLAVLGQFSPPRMLVHIEPPPVQILLPHALHLPVPILFKKDSYCQHAGKKWDLGGSVHNVLK